MTTPLESIRAQLEIFINAMFCRCGDEGVVSLRSFYEDRSITKPFRITNISLKGGLPFLLEAAEDDARRAANNPKPVVFSPPVATFHRNGNGSRWIEASEKNISEAPELSVELDENPRAALEILERLLGRATLVVRSGGVWINPTTGECEDKLHVHWRLKEPACGDDIAKLKRARQLATALVGGDPSNVPVCHPIRWPGSVHRKAEPRLCEIISQHLENEIDVDLALAALEDVAPPEVLSLRTPRTSGANGGDAEAQAPSSMVAAAVAAIPNPDLKWKEWNDMGLRIFAATGGSKEGLEIFQAFSKKSAKHHSPETAKARWEHFHNSPPDSTGYNKLAAMATLADPTWLDRFDAKQFAELERANRAALGEEIIPPPPPDEPARIVCLLIASEEGDTAAFAAPCGRELQLRATEDGDGASFSALLKAVPPPPPPKRAELFDPWQEFIVPEFPLDVLPKVAREFVHDQSRAIGVDQSAMAMSVLAAFSGAIHHRFCLKMMRDTDWFEHMRLWVLLVGRPSWKKTPAMNAATRPIERHQAEVMRDYRARMRDYERAGDDEKPDKPEPPERFIVSDTTTEKLGEILSRSDRGVLGKFDEVAGWIGQMERYHGGGKGASSDRAIWLQGWNGGPYPIDRVKGEIFVNNLSVSILGGIQPARLHEIHGLTSDGLLQRYLAVLMQAASLPQEIDCRESNKAYQALIYQLIKLRPQRLYLAEDAIEVMDALRTHLFHLEQVGEALSAGFEGFVGKLPSCAAALAMILHLVGDPKCRCNVVSRPVVENVNRIIRDFILPHAQEFYSQGEGESERLRKLASYVLTCGKDVLRLSDLTSDVRDCRGLTVLALNQRISPLVAGGWLIPNDPGPACRFWVINRSVIDAQFAERARDEEKRKQAVAELMAAPRRSKAAGKGGV